LTIGRTKAFELTGAKRNLDAAKAAKNDEFYTQWADIEREMNAYLEFNPDVFRGKVVLLPCDDPEWSNFTKFFRAPLHGLRTQEAHLDFVRRG
jgi:Adenine-specific methyltransferase EcoRI